jgi:hypothetical protein
MELFQAYIMLAVFKKILQKNIQKHKSGRGPSSEHFWQVWLISVQRFQRRRFKCEKLTDGRTDGRRIDSYFLFADFVDF